MYKYVHTRVQVLKTGLIYCMKKFTGFLLQVITIIIIDLPC